MNMPMVTGLQPSGLIAEKKKRVLLIDTSRVKRDLRSETMRKLGAEVDCAADISEARSWWRPNLYDLVLIHADNGKAQTDKFCEDMRRGMPNQRIMFLVGKPEYLASVRNIDPASGLPSEQEVDSYRPLQSAAETNASANVSQSWGILEACRRISAVRSEADARSRAIRERPEPKRDPEVSRSSIEQRDNLETLLTDFGERATNEEPLRGQPAPQHHRDGTA